MARNISLWHKTAWRLARTPAAGWIKRYQRLFVSDAIATRRELGRSLPRDVTITQTAKDFNRLGYCRLDELVDPALLHAAARAAAEKYAVAARASQAQEVHLKDFWSRLLDEDKIDGMLPTDNPFVAFALQPRILALLSEIYGELPFLDDVLLVLSRPTGKQLTLSQLWHHDYDDVRTIKLYIYLSDVACQEDGPFTFLPASASARVGMSLRSRRADEEIASKVPFGEIVQMIAPRLSVFMVETSRCLHMGSRVAAGHERLMYMASFISVPRMYPEPPPRFRLSGLESDVIRCVLTPARTPA